MGAQTTSLTLVREWPRTLKLIYFSFFYETITHDIYSLIITETNLYQFWYGTAQIFNPLKYSRNVNSFLRERLSSFKIWRRKFKVKPLQYVCRGSNHFSYTFKGVVIATEPSPSSYIFQLRIWSIIQIVSKTLKCEVMF